MTKIEWAEETWNPITGCSPISEGCANCYAQRMSKRLAGRFGYDKNRPFDITFHEYILRKPFEWKQSKMIFVCSMGDIFHENVPDEWIDMVFDTMIAADWHTFLILTKRPERMRQYLTDLYYDYDISEHSRIPFPNIWLGVTAENQEQANKRIPVLLDTPSIKRFVSIEPMLGEISLGETAKAKLGWVICGAETGQGKREMKKEWAKDLQKQCSTFSIPFFFKKDSAGNSLLDDKELREMPGGVGMKIDDDYVVLKGGAENDSTRANSKMPATN